MILPQQQLACDSPLSSTEKIWSFTDPNPRLIQTMMQRYGLTEVIASILVGRGIPLEGASSYLNPSLRDLLPDPSTLLDMDIGVERVFKSIKNQEKIAIFGDYDVDGATSSALIKRYLSTIGVGCEIYIPDRIVEGYGPNVPALQALKDRGAAVIIMVDCGTTAFEPLAYAHNIGLDLVVLDHHVAQPALPEATAIINPNRLDENNPALTGLCAAGLSFMFIVALNRRLRQEGWFESRPEPDLRQFLDLVALGTVCDVMPLSGLNRAYVALGLRVLSRRSNLGLSALADCAGVSEIMSTYHLGFLLGPRINAGGRVGEASLGATLLSSENPTEVREIAQRLDLFNQERQAIELEVLEAAFRQVDDLKLHDRPLILVSGDGWHPGVIGIVAGRIKERYSRPACVVGYQGDIGKGSGRSVSGIDLGTAMHQALQKGHLVQGGGHAMAAGFTVMREQFDDFYDFLCDRFESQRDCLIPRIKIDSTLSLSGITNQLADQLKALEPFGQGNPQPRFLIKNARLSYVEAFGNGHIRGTLMAEDGSRISALAFRSVGTPLGDALLTRPPLADLVVTIKDDYWNGMRQIKVMIEDVKI